MIATSIIQGGPAPHCFSAAVADMLVHCEVQSDIDLPEIVVQEKMTQVSPLNSIF